MCYPEAPAPRSLALIAVVVFCLFVLLAPVPVSAQDGRSDIKATTVYAPDGSRTETVKDLSEGTGKAEVFDAAGHLTKRITYKLDEEGREMEGTAFLPQKKPLEDKPLYSFSFKRNSAGQILEEHDMNLAGNLFRRLVYTYDSYGRVAAIDTYDGQGNLVGSTAKKKQQKKR